MTVAEIVWGSWFGSVALVTDGRHMSTHAGARLIAALAYTYARRHATDSRSAFGTRKLGHVAGYHQRHCAGDDRIVNCIRVGERFVDAGQY